MSSAPRLRGRAARLARMFPTGPSRAARTPFVLLVVVLLSGGLITLLMLNSSLNEGSFQLSRLKKETTDLTDQEQELQHDVNGYSDPDALQRRARELGLVPGGDPAFLGPDGRVRGVPSTASPSALRTRAPAASPGPSATASPNSPATPRSSASARLAAESSTPFPPAGSPAPSPHRSEPRQVTQ
ncbi:septum formation initiator [Streptomyces sp. NPDC058045]|uniref:septum formation initiator n=1 Tax=Streptomyces sp. NPDC058045 TaxID=3346311 RepID=UPI0036F06741